MFLKRSFLYIGITLIIFLTACNGTSTQEKIYEHLEEAVHLESDFADEQDKIIELEKQEQEIYEQIVDLEMGEFDTIKELSQQALEIIAERSNKIELEKESIDASQNEFKQVEELIEELDNEEEKEKLEELYDVMLDRYEAYNALHDAYVQSLEEEKEMYSMIQQEDMTQEELTDQVNNINENYEAVLEGNEAFNKSTVAYNDLKKEFYELANIAVEYKED